MSQAEYEQQKAKGRIKAKPIDILINGARNLVANQFFFISGQFHKALTFKRKLKNALHFNNPILIIRFDGSQDNAEQLTELARKFCKKYELPLILNTPNKYTAKCDGIHLNQMSSKPPLKLIKLLVHLVMMNLI
ncbi:MAG: hypothetical protein CM15mP12_4910 [Gammaproteobacteria bacterium]|nr:MAG: hypothetical protein CM15mP12_4910 [Gammaproteobacteria bacterium]